MNIAAHQQFAIDHADAVKGCGYFGKCRRDFITTTTEQPGFTAGGRDLNTDAIPFPFGDKIIKIYIAILQRMGKHEGPEERAIGGVGTLGFALAPRKQFGIRQAKRVPYLLDIIHGKTKSLPKGGFGEPRRYINTHAACRQFEQRITAIGIKPIHQFRQHRPRTRAACAAQHFDDFRHRRCDNVLADVWPH